MKPYILFFSGIFNDMDEIEDSLGEAFSNVDFESIKYVFESSRNGIIIFKSDHNRVQLNRILMEVMTYKSITSYFLFELDVMISTYLSTVVKDFIYDEIENDENVLKYNKGAIENTETIKNEQPFELDLILEKIDTYGVDSLTENEKTFLDNYDKEK